jgi:prephenate dehydrogenase
MDLGSTKQTVVNAMESLPAQCIGGHPMCGKETSGLEAAEANLFRGAKFVLTPTTRTTDETLTLIQSLVTRIGAHPLCMNAAAHDRAVAAISHLPYLLSTSLVNTVDTLHDAHTTLLASSGYQSTTRLAASDTRMMGDIIATNRAHIVAMLDAYQAELTQLRDALATEDERGWREKLEQAKKVKSKK